jgi:hypothetical protein
VTRVQDIAACTAVDGNRKPVALRSYQLKGCTSNGKKLLRLRPEAGPLEDHAATLDEQSKDVGHFQAYRVCLRQMEGESTYAGKARTVGA